MSDTPITDAAIHHDETICEIEYQPDGWVKAAVARQLERDLNQLLGAYRHRHINSGVGDGCLQCGLDLRNPIHR